MPGTLTRPPAGSASDRLGSFAVEDLSTHERAVALYASDMPTRYRYRKTEDALLLGWIEQGAARLGTAALRERAAHWYGYRLLNLAHLATEPMHERHARAFPNARRADRAEQLAALIAMYDMAPMTEDARRRNRAAEVEDCPCDDAHVLAYGTDEEEGDLVCLVHHPLAWALRERGWQR